MLHTALQWQQQDLKHTTDALYLTLTGELWGVCCEDIGEIGARYNGTALYFLKGDCFCTTHYRDHEEIYMWHKTVRVVNIMQI